MFSDTGSVSKTRNTSKMHAESSGHINNTAPTNMQYVFIHDNKMALKKETGQKKIIPKKSVSNELLRTEINLLDYAHKLRLSLKTDHANYQVALDILEKINDLNINFLMLVKNKEIVDTINKLKYYVGNPADWGLNEQETAEHIEKSALIRNKSETIFNKFKLLFTIPDGETFQDAYNKAVEDFFTRNKNLTLKQIYRITLDTYYK